MSIPTDPVILLSYINTRLRDFYPNLDELCADLSVDREELVKKLAVINYHYDSQTNQFI